MFIFEIDFVVDFINERKAEGLYKKLIEDISPTHLITNSVTDKFASKKKEHANELGIEFLDSKDSNFIQ